VDATQQQTIAQPAFETELRAKAREIIDTLGELEAQASPVTFTVQGVDCELAWADNDARLAVASGAYQWRIPRAWLTAPPT
jgi:hypothetical protein